VRRCEFITLVGGATPLHGDGGKGPVDTHVPTVSFVKEMIRTSNGPERKIGL
jgi:hypothetical protein